MEKNHWEDIVENGPDRLDRWLHRNLPSYSMSSVRDIIAGGRVLVNGVRSKKGRQLSVGDVVEVVLAETGPIPLADDSIAVEIVYEDDDVLIVNKPSGIPTQPLSPEETGSLVNGVVAEYPKLRGVGDKELEPGLIHRLDAGTFGLVLFAKNRKSFDFLRHDVSMRRVTKIYRALVGGRFKSASGEIKTPLAHHSSRKGLMVAVTPGVKYRGEPRPTLTRYKVLGHDKGTSLVELDLVTGVTHQLRAHMALLGHPVLGDDRYGEDPTPGSRSFALQAYRLAFAGPSGKSPIDVICPEPLSLEDLDKWR